MKLFISIPSVTILILCLCYPAISQSPNKAETKTPDVTQLRAALSEAAGEGLQIVKDELVKRSQWNGGDVYWLAHVRANESAVFQIKYSYQYHTSHYSHVEREFYLTVAPSGCRRGVIGRGEYGTVCIGDTVIIPFIISKFTAHKFSVTKRAYQASATGPGTWQAQPVKLGEIENPAAANLKYLGHSSHKLLHRNGGYTVQVFAQFEAVSPGKFNLDLSGNINSGKAAGVPVIIVPLGPPLTILALHEEVTGYSRGAMGQEWASSTSGNSYGTSVLMMQPGDRITLHYGGYSRRARFERDEPGNKSATSALEEVAPPVIRKLPFEIDPNEQFNEWIEKHLPR